ncbi:MAG: undecaprenyl/decaprenyl-phosphate alpha-N-acetylglucosaminyl 1-phosphate transferase [Anaerohalosphaeraceae bacterium]|nr:undecaprenyl/decaprenyl-phosphate alpha-N-acetylglucosaminyl 1-phosphate transferase [Anaerohalosphaeraceae bacterium]
MNLKLGLFSLILFTVSLAVSLLLTAIVKKLAIKADFVAHPKADRFHKSIIPMGGGIAIFATIVLFCLAAIVAVKTISIDSCPILSDNCPAEYLENFAGKIFQLCGILIAASVLFLLGLWDDIKGFGPFLKLAVQFAVAFLAAYFAEVRVEFFIESKIITSALSAFWIVLIMNAFNFLDNMDGASAGIALVVTIILFFAAALAGQVFIAGFAMVFAGTLAGFLVFNFFPASIFMGDAGSLVVGFFVAMLTLRTDYYQQSSGGQIHAVLMPLIIMALPLYDFTSVCLLRISQGKSPFVGDTQHFSHRLNKRGLSQKQTVLTLYLATFCTGAAAIVLKNAPLGYAILIFIQTIAVLAIIAILETAGKNDGQ